MTTRFAHRHAPLIRPSFTPVTLLALLLCLVNLRGSRAQMTYSTGVVNIASTGATTVLLKQGAADLLSGFQTAQNLSRLSFAMTYPKFANNDMTNFATLATAFTSNATNPATTSAIILDGTTQALNGLTYLAGYYRIPLILCSINPTVVGLQRSVYPYVISNYMPDALLVDGFLTLAQRLKWTRVAVFATLELTGITLVNYLYQRLSAYPDIQVSVFYLAYPDPTQFKTSSLTQLAAMQSQGFLIGYLGLYKAQMTTFINLAYQAGMTGPPYQWVGINGICSSTGNLMSGTLIDPRAALGVLCLLQGLPRAVERTTSGSLLAYTEFLWRFNGQSGVQFNTQIVSWATCYDAVYLLAQAMQAIINTAGSYTVNGSALLSAMQSVNTTGPASGFPISFTSAGDIATGSLDIFEWVTQPDDSFASWTFVGSYSALTKQWQMLTDITFWSSSGNSAPLDYIPILTDGATIELTYNAAAGVAPIAILLVSLWSTTLTMRYAVTTKRRARHPTAHREWLSSVPFLTAIVHWPSSAFVLVAALQFSLGAVSSFHYSTFCLQSTDPLTLSFNVSTFIGACCLAVGCAYASFLLLHWQVQYHSMAAEEVVGHSSTKGSQTSDVAGGKRATMLSNKLQDASSFICARWLREAVAVVQTVPLLTVLSAALLTLSVSASFHIAAASLILPADATITGLVVVAPLLLLLPVLTYTLHAHFLLLTTSSAIKTTLCMAAVIIVEQLLDTAAYTFAFSQVQYADSAGAYNASGSSAISTANALIFCCAVAACVMLIWLGMFMHINQMSKGILDLLILQAHRERERAEADYRKAAQRTLSAMEQLNRFRKYAAINAGIRPLYRSYACALDINRLVDSAPDVASMADAMAASDNLMAPSNPTSPKLKKPTRGMANGSHNSSGGPAGSPAQSMFSPSIGARSILPRAVQPGGQPQLRPAATRQQPSNLNTQLVLSMYAELDGPDALNRWSHLTSAPLSAEVADSISILDLLHHPVCLEVVKDAALQVQQEISQKGLLEAITAWLDIVRYRQIGDGALRLQMAREMFVTYFGGWDGTTSPLPVTISPVQQRMLATNLKSKDGTVSRGTIMAASNIVPAANLFDAVALELLQRLTQKLLPSIRDGPMMTACAVLLERVNIPQASAAQG